MGVKQTWQALMQLSGVVVQRCDFPCCVTATAEIIRLLNEPQPRGTPVTAATGAMICSAINLAGEISADLSSPTNEAVKLPLLLHVCLWMNPADGSRMLPIPGLNGFHSPPGV